MANLFIKESTYKPFDTPDYEDYFPKLRWYLEKTVRYGAIWASVDIIGITKPKGYFPTIARFSKIFFPIQVTGMVYPTVCYMVAKARKVDGELNHVIAAAATSFTVGYFMKSGIVGGHLAPVFMLAVLGLKYNSLLGVSHEPPFLDWLHLECENLTIYDGTHNYSLYKPRPKGWIRAEDVGKLQNNTETA